MSKTKKIKTISLEKAIMKKVKSNEITMKPRWHFIAGSIFSFIGLVAFTIVAIYLTNLILFLLKKHGPMGEFRLQQILTNFPWWIPLLAIIGIIGGIFFLKKYDFSYKKNFWFVIIGFIISIIFAAFVINNLGLNDLFERQGSMRGFYRQLQDHNSDFKRGQGLQNGQFRLYKGKGLIR